MLRGELCSTLHCILINVIWQHWQIRSMTTVKSFVRPFYKSFLPFLLKFITSHHVFFANCNK